jgi:hypothetical protein
MHTIGDAVASRTIIEEDDKQSAKQASHKKQEKENTPKKKSEKENKKENKYLSSIHFFSLQGLPNAQVP